MTMSPTQGPFKHVVAFEVSKTSLVVHRLPGDEQDTITNAPQAVRRLLRAEMRRNTKAKLGPLLVVVEATGGYERHVLDAASSSVLRATGRTAHACASSPGT